MILRLMVLAFALALPAHAQTGSQSSMQGIVTDPSDAVIVGAAVSTTNVGTSEISTTISDSNGLFRFPVLPPGSYELTVKHPGFVTFIQKNLTLTVGAKVDLAIRLEIAGPTESVKVSGEPPMIETTRASFSTTVDVRSISSLPLNGRNFVSLVLLTPGITDAAGTPFFSGQNWMNSLVVDGADHNAFGVDFVGGSGNDSYLFSQEAVQEFQVNTSSFGAEFGRAGAGVVNVVTKSGTNDYHGSLFWYYRDRGMNATGFINKLNDEPKDPLHVHQFGGAGGGPIVKNRLFLYGSYDGQRRSEQNLTYLNIPSGFAFSPDPTLATFQHLAFDYLRDRAAPFLRTFNLNVSLMKLDWRLSPAHLLSGRWNHHRLNGENSANLGPQQSLEHTGPLEQIVDSLSLSFRSTISPSKVNVALFSYVSSTNRSGSNNANPEANVFEGGQQVLLAGRHPRTPVENSVRRFEVSDTLSLSRGLHSLRLGSNVMLDLGKFFSTVNFYGGYRFNSLESFGRSRAAQPVPQPGERYVQAFSGIGKPPISVHPNYVEVALFAQDEWRVRPTLTLSAGIRYDVQVMTEEALHNPSEALAEQGIDTGYVPTDANNFAPRLGAAWSPLASKRLVVRAGYGLNYPRLVANFAARAYFQNGIISQTRTFRADRSNETLWIPAYPNTICGPPDPLGAAPTCPAPVDGADLIMAFARSHRQSAVHQYNFSIEYQVQENLALSISYLGVRGVHLQHWQDANLANPTPTLIGIAGTSTLLTYRRFPASRPLTEFDRILMLQTNANSNYHGLAIQATKRFSNNFQFLASYTFAKSIDDNPVATATNPPSGDSTLLSDSLDPSLDRGAGIFDQRHRFVANGIWQLKYAGKLANPAKTILSGWELSGIYVVNSGIPYSGLVGFDLNNDGNAATDRLPGLGRNTFHLPTTASLDLRVSRDIPIGTRARLQARFEAFNLFNRVNTFLVRDTYYARSTSPTECGVAGTPCLVPQTDPVTGFGSPISTLDPRILQLSLRLLF